MPTFYHCFISLFRQCFFFVCTCANLLAVSFEYILSTTIRVMKALALPSVSHSHHRIGSLLSSRFVMNMEPEHLLQLIKDLSELLNNQQKENLLEHLTTHMHLGHLESLRLTSRLHSTCIPFGDCYDFVSWLPPELVARIFSYLPWDSLVACSLVNRSWFRAARNPELYRRLCQLPEWGSPTLDRGPQSLSFLSRTMDTIESTDQIVSPSSFASSTMDHKTIDWFGIFKTRSRLRRNWLLGKHRTRRFTGHSEAIYCVACDAHRIVSGSADATIRVWNVRTNATWSVQTLRGHSDAVRCLQLLPLASASASPLFVSSSSASSPQSSSSCSPSSTCQSPSNFFDCRTTLSPTVIDDKQPPEALLISGSSDTTVKLWRLSSNTDWSRIACVRTLQGHTDTVRCLQADHEKVISGSYDCTLRLWDLNTNQLGQVFRGHSAGVVCLVYDNRLLYSGSLDNTVRVWNLSSAECLYILYRSVPCLNAQHFWLTPVSSLHLDPVRNRLLIAHHDGLILSWLVPPDSFDHLRASPYPNPIATTLDRRTDVSTRSTSREPVGIHLTDRFATIDDPATGSVLRCIVGDAWHIVSGSDNKTLKVWRTDNDQLINVLHGHDDGVTCVVITPTRVVSGSYDKSIILYDFDIA
ncbi:F-box/WD repeat-containing protein pof1 [Fasciola hepatica]|uniref:F-box/WD repeat-containing protein pof1 n=1 Tax=Fasciola hepatica TaxID=6192 RepID=A0A4E0RT73_FASHE|nr:F-box/WD repeat-containing protein pof1 [Fasciola hepatica]